MKVYTKTGDEGTTSKYNGERVPKDDPIIILGNKIDFLLGALDSSLAILKEDELVKLLENIEKKLWQTAGEISLGKPGKNVTDAVSDSDVEALEENIDKFNQKTNFFVRFRKETSVRLNEARLRCRDLEIALTPSLRETKVRSVVYKYINRLSDLLYVLACFEEKKA
ncbi:hypothetical protein COV13_01250 [Candidatus Woesearchaeota archaeon CG10_big_fil_rev_8_21_14_0_10_32_9]|nr:MAG: hypothetical protein COV13_01250 [Candidatus Woesearchaeota archaeon CG10_big_fil_rev_8_21_14_0_10_32_9]